MINFSLKVRVMSFRNKWMIILVAFIIISLSAYLSMSSLSDTSLVSDNEKESQELESRLSNLESKVKSLEEIIEGYRDTDVVDSGPFSNPEYDSGWIPLDPGGLVS
jgi:hypothetical protein